MAKKSLKIKKMGEGIMDIVKPVAQELAPVAVDALVKVAKKKIGGDILTDLAKQVIPMILSGGQIRKLKKGGAITIKPEMVSDVAETALSLLPQSAQKILKSVAQNKGVRYVLKQGEDLINRSTGSGIFDSLKSLAKSASPVVSSIAKEVAPIALDIGADYAKKKVAGMGMRRKKVVGCGNPYISKPYKDAMRFIHSEGGSIYPAGQRGGSFLPAGEMSSGGALSEQPSGPVQLGSPYLSSSSPAMRPFFQEGNPFRYAPLGKSKSGGDIGSDIMSGLSTVAKFAPLIGLL